MNMAAKMKAALASGESSEICESVQNDYRLWLVFFSDIERNPDRLPADLRNNIIRLCHFVFSKAVEAMFGNCSLVTTMIEINRLLANGLRSQAPAPVPALSDAAVATEA